MRIIDDQNPFQSCFWPDWQGWPLTRIDNKTGVFSFKKRPITALQQKNWRNQFRPTALLRDSTTDGAVIIFVEFAVVLPKNSNTMVIIGLWTYLTITVHLHFISTYEKVAGKKWR